MTMASVAKPNNIFKNLELANAAALTFFIMGSLAILSGYKIKISSIETVWFIANFAFLHGFHIIFQYWMIYKSPEYTRAVELSTGMSNLINKMIVTTIFLALAIGAAKAFSINHAIFEVIFIGWAMLHTIGQTYGIYCAKMSPKPGEASVFRTDYKILKTLVLFSVFIHVAITVSEKFTVPFSFTQPMLWGIVGIKYLMIVSVLAWLLKNKKMNSDAGWLLLRFWIGASALFFPYAKIAFAAIHGAEYFDLAKNAEMRSSQKSSHGPMIAVFMCLLVIVAVNNFNHVFNPAWFGPVATIILGSFDISLTLVHYLFDTFAYKMRNKEARTILVGIIK